CPPLDRAPPLGGGRAFYPRAFPTAGHPSARSGITTQLSGPLLRRNLHPPGKCCYGLQLRSERVIVSRSSPPLRPDPPVSPTPPDFTSSAYTGGPARQLGLGCERHLPCFGSVFLPHVPSLSLVLGKSGILNSAR